MRTEIRLAGRGGQGQVLAGIILAEAALRAGLNAVQTQSYGPESRGGASKAEVIVSDGDIDYPKVVRPDILLAMSQEALDQYGPEVDPEGLIVVDSSLVESIPDLETRVHRVPITKMAAEDLGKAIVANIVALGVIAGITELVPDGDLEQAVLERVPEGTEDLNRSALKAGLAAGRDLMRSGEN